MTKKKLAVVALVATVALSLSGCIKSVTNIVIHDNDTVSGRYIFAIEKTYAEGMSMEDIVSQLGGDTATEGMTNATSKPYDDGTFTGTEVNFADEPLSAIQGSDGSVVHEGGTFVFDAPAPDLTSMEGMPDADKAVATLTVTFPGAVTDHNGSLSGTTVTWNMLTQTEAPHAVGGATGSGDDGGVPSSAGGDGSSLPMLLIIALGVVVVGAIVFFVVKSRGGSKSKSADTSVSTETESTEEPKK
jgi:hypothetical protein